MERAPWGEQTGTTWGAMFSLYIELGNDEMMAPEDVADALEHVASRLRTISNPEEHLEHHLDRIQDDNGNTVGEYEFNFKPE
jgi:phosphopantetheine adenylyltransferase